ncbi:MAG: alpha/beta fold hydrolase [candidate division Zixibacteria bacterium]|nr:alpha/beta fold hydrolase [candidate division Zixibacteria bacterium]
MKQRIPTVALLIIAVIILAFDAFADTAEELGMNKKPGFISVPDGRLYYEEAGKGTCIVFLHDGIFHSEVYDSQFAAFAENHRVIRYDRRGYGRSDDAHQPYSNIDDLKAVFDTLGIDSALVVGCSAGSALAIDFTLKYPHLVTGLVLIGPVVSGMGYTSHMLTRGGHMTSDILTDPERTAAYFVDTDPYEFCQSSHEAKAKARALLAAFPHNADFSDGYFERGPDRPAVRFLSEIKVPTLIIVGEGDVPDVHAHSGAIEAGISSSQREVVSKAGHLVALEKPQEVIDLIRSFLAESMFFNMISREGMPAAVKAYRESLARNPEQKPLAESRLNQLGYQSLLSGNINGALALFELAVDIYPGSFNVYDSYGEALLASGDTAQAITNYKRSLELNPNNTNATQVLSGISKK